MKTVIIDYGVGNLKSVEKAFEFIGSPAIVTSDYREVLSADRVILPGVGAFREAMSSLEKYEMDRAVKETIAEGKKFLGICLGMQLLFDYSEEGDVEGLGILKGKIKKFPLMKDLKIPHMGWNSIDYSKKCDLFNNINDPFVYFVHSYYLDAEQRDVVSARTNYGIDFDSAVHFENIYATQFHPEKSGETGLKMLRNFVLED